MFKTLAIVSVLLLFHVSKANQELNRSLRNNEKSISSRPYSDFDNCSQQLNTKKKIVCVYRIEEHFRPYDLNPCLCTHVIYSNVAVRDNSVFVAGKKGDLFFLTSLKAQNPKLKVLVSLRFTGKTLLDSMSPQNPTDTGHNELIYTKFANRVRDFIISHGIDGIDLDAKYLTDDDNLTVKKDVILSLTKALRYSFQQRNGFKSGQKELLISITCSKYPRELTEHYDFINIKKFVDFVNVAAFQFEGDDRIVRHPARLHGISDMENLDSIVDLILALGLPEEQIVVGVPAFGVHYRLSNATQFTPGSATNQIRSNNSIIPYSKLCTIRDNSSWTLVREKDLTAPYIHFEDNWIGFDDEISIKLKVKYSILRNLGGIALWTVNDDDTIGKCGFGTFPLLNTISEVLSESNMTKNQESSFAVIEKYGNVERIVEMEDEESDSQLECKRSGYIQNPKDCSRFYRCIKFDEKDKLVNKFQYGCPTGLVFDEINEICNWPSWSSSCHGSGEIIKVTKKKFTCSTYGYFQDPENCEYFFYCSDFGKGNFHGYQFKCPFNLAFDEEKLLCNWKWLVKGCNLQIDSKPVNIDGREILTSESSYDKSHELSEDIDEFLPRSDEIENTGKKPLTNPIPAEHRSEEFGSRKSFARFIRDQVTSVIDSIDNKVKNFFGYSKAQRRQDDGNRFINWFSSPFGLSPQLTNTKSTLHERRAQPHQHRLTGEDPFVSIPVIEVLPKQSNIEKTRKWNKDNSFKILSNTAYKGIEDSENLKFSPSKEVIVMSKSPDIQKTRFQTSNKVDTIPIPIFTLRNSRPNLSNMQQIQRRPDGSDVTHKVFNVDSTRPQHPLKLQQSSEVRNTAKSNGALFDSGITLKSQKNIIRQPFSAVNQQPPIINSQLPLSNRVKWPQSSPVRIQNQPIRIYKDSNPLNNLGNSVQYTGNSNKVVKTNVRPQETTNFEIDMKQFDLQAASVEDALESDSYLQYPNVAHVLQRLPFATEPARSTNRLPHLQTHSATHSVPHNFKNSVQAQMAHVPQKLRQFTNTMYSLPKQSHYGINIPESKPRLNISPINKHSTPGIVTKNGFVPVTHNPKTVTVDSVKLWKPNGKTLEASSSSLEYSVYKENDSIEGEETFQNKLHNKVATVDATTIDAKKSQKNPKTSKTPQLLIIPVPDNHPKAQSFEEIQKMQNLYPELFSGTFNYNTKVESATKTTKVSTVSPVTEDLLSTKQNPRKTETNRVTEDSISSNADVNIATTLSEHSSTNPPIQYLDQKKNDQKYVDLSKINLPSSNNNLLSTQQNLSQSLYDSIQQVIAQHINSQLKNIDIHPRKPANEAKNFNFPVTPSTLSSTRVSSSSTVELTSTTLSQSIVPAKTADTHIGNSEKSKEIKLSNNLKHENSENLHRKWPHQPSWYQYHKISSGPVLNSNHTHQQNIVSEGIYPVYQNLENRLNSQLSNYSTSKLIAAATNNEQHSSQSTNSQRLYYKEFENKLPHEVSTEALIVEKPIEILRTKANTPQIQVYIVQGADRQQVQTRTVVNDGSNVKVFVIDESNNKVNNKNNDVLESEKKLESVDKYEHYYSGSELKSTQITNTSTKETISEANTEPETEDVEYEDTVGSSDEKLSTSQSIPTNKKQSLQSIYNSHPKLRNFTENSVPESACSRPGLFQHPQDCNKFYECYWDKFINKYTLHSFDCPVKLAFDSRIIGCSSPFDSTVCVQY